MKKLQKHKYRLTISLCLGGVCVSLLFAYISQSLLSG